MAVSDKKLVFVGGGGHCKAVIDVATSVGRPILGIIDNNLAIGSSVAGIPVIGSDNDLKHIIEYVNSIEFIVTIGQIKSPLVRKKLVDTITELGGTLAEPVIASTAHIAIGTKIGRGTVVMHNAVINTEAKIGENCIINTGAIVEHDCIVGDFVHISTGAIINGACSIGNNTFIGSHATVVNGKNIANDVVVGAGATVTCDITQPGTYCGTPAKQFK